jgi:hypothetical protein
MIFIMEGVANESEMISLNRSHNPPKFFDTMVMDRTENGIRRCSIEGKLCPIAREDENTTPILEMESHDLVENRPDELDVVLYPAGGAFNKLRKKQVFLEQLLIQHWASYSVTPSHLKKEYVEKHILQPIRKSGRQFKIFQGSTPANGSYWIPNADVAFDRLAQKLRDTKKTSMIQLQGDATPRPRRIRRKVPTTPSIVAAPPQKRRKVTRSKKTSAVKGTPLTTLESSSSSVISYTSYGDTVQKKSHPKAPRAETNLVVPRARGAVSMNRKSSALTTTVATDPSTSLKELQEVVWSQWEQIDCWRRLCARYKETNEVQREVIRQQNAMLANGKNEYAL